MTDSEPAVLADQAKNLYKEKQFEKAAQLFNAAANGFTLGRDGLMAAEMSNNESVAWLQAGKAQEAYTASKDTDKVFASAKDLKRQAIALCNQAAALANLKQTENALALYDQAYKLFDEIGEKDMRSYVSRAIADIKFGQGKMTDAAFKLLGSLESKEQPDLRERILLSLLRFFYRRIYRTK